MKMKFTYGPRDLQPIDVGESDSSKFKFDDILKQEWDDALDNGYFKYQLDNLETKRIPGKLEFVAQLNTKRGTHRRPPHSFEHVQQPFDPSLFNFTKINPKEILFTIAVDRERKGDSSVDHEEEISTENEHQVIINASPLEFGHSLLLPSVAKCYPQAITLELARMMLDICLLSRNPNLIVGFNSLCAFASINHQHAHIYYMDHPLKLQSAALTHLARDCLFETEGWPVNGFAFVLNSKTKLSTSARSLFLCVDYLQKQEIAHNITCLQERDSEGSWCGVRAFVWPRKSTFGAKHRTAMSAAFCEISGHLILLEAEKGFNAVTEESAVAMLHEVSLEDGSFSEIRHVFSRIVETNVPGNQ